MNERDFERLKDTQTMDVAFTWHDIRLALRREPERM